MKKIFVLSLVLLSLAACKKQENVFVCGDYNVQITISQDGEKMNAVINGDELELVHAISASGARYVGVLNDTNVELWNKGKDWTMFLNEEEPIFCK